MCRYIFIHLYLFYIYTNIYIYIDIHIYLDLDLDRDKDRWIDKDIDRYRVNPRYVYRYRCMDGRTGAAKLEWCSPSTTLYIYMLYMCMYICVCV